MPCLSSTLFIKEKLQLLVEREGRDGRKRELASKKAATTTITRITTTTRRRRRVDRRR
jgi:hypothetical protein